MSELSKCPFCGGEAFVRIDITLDPVQSRYRVGCDKNPYCHGWYGHSRYYNTEAEAVEAWNTRHVETDALREACRELVAYAGTCPFDAKCIDTANWSERCDRECSTDVDMAACWMRYFLEVER